MERPQPHDIHAKKIGSDTLRSLFESSAKASSPRRHPRKSRRQRHAFGREWRATRLVDELTGNSYVGIDYPTRLQGSGFEVIDEDIVEQPVKVRLLLKKRGAALNGSKKDQIRFVGRLLRKLADEPLMLAMKPGFRGDGFVLGNRMLGTAVGKYRWKSPLGQAPANGELGDTGGTRGRWNKRVGKTALKSTTLAFGLMAGLASCVPGYVESRVKKSQPLLPETMTFDLEGESGSGKTNVLKAIAGLVGPPDLIAHWDFTRRGFEELVETRNHLPFLIDDTEMQVEDGMSLKTALRHVTQIVPKGASKHISTKSHQNDLPVLSWSTVGVTTSPPDMEGTARRLGWNRTQGERVRFICVPVPPVSKGGIFDTLTGNAAEQQAEAKRLTSDLERGTARAYGHIFPLWIEYLLKENRSRRILELMNFFVDRVVPHGDGWDARLARKFGLLYATGYLAVEAGILPWPKKWCLRAVKRCYRRAIRSFRSDHLLAERVIQHLANNAADERTLPTVRTGRTLRLPEPCQSLSWAAVPSTTAKRYSPFALIGCSDWLGAEASPLGFFNASKPSRY
jgi:hypothetical protein